MAARKEKSDGPVERDRKKQRARAELQKETRRRSQAANPGRLDHPPQPIKGSVLGRQEITGFKQAGGTGTVRRKKR